MHTVPYWQGVPLGRCIITVFLEARLEEIDCIRLVLQGLYMNSSNKSLHNPSYCQRAWTSFLYEFFLLVWVLRHNQCHFKSVQSFLCSIYEEVCFERPRIWFHVFRHFWGWLYLQCELELFNISMKPPFGLLFCSISFCSI